MAGDWIKMRVNLDSDPAVVRLSSGCKLDRYSVVGRLHRIWSWANQHLTDGMDVPVDAAFLDSLVDHSGFAAAMREVGWLSGRDGSLSFPVFERHNGASAKARGLDSARKAEVRNRSKSVRVQTGQNSDQRREEKSNPPIAPRVGGESGSTSEDSFDEFWGAYPRKQGKGKARDAFKRKKCATFLPKVLATLAKLKISGQWKRDGGQFIPFPATWLNREGWDDEVKPEKQEKLW